LRLAIAVALVCSSAPALAQVEIVRPVPRAAGTHGFTIEVPTPGAYGSFEVLRGGRVPDAAAAEEAVPVAPPASNAGPRTIQIAPVRPVEVAPVGLHGRAETRSDSGTVRVQRGPFARAPVPAAADPGEEQAQTLPPLPAGARVIRIR
jgi:hypothetical protein